MPRIARTMIEGLPYHITQRGNRREDVFFEAEDRKKYLEWLKEYSEKYGFGNLGGRFPYFWTGERTMKEVIYKVLFKDYLQRR